MTDNKRRNQGGSFYGESPSEDADYGQNDQAIGNKGGQSSANVEENSATTEQRDQDNKNTDY